MMRRLQPDLSGMVIARGHEVRIRANNGENDGAPLPDDDASWLLQEAHEFGPRWIVVDSYAAGAEYLGRIAGRAGRLCVLDDLADRDLRAADLVVNPTPEADTWPYVIGPSTKLLAGPAFALLHRAFPARRGPSLQRRAGAVPVERVLVCMGGADTTNLSERVVNAVLAVLPRAKVRTVVGPGRADVDSPGGSTSAEYVGKRSPEEMADLMLWADLAVATPSTIAWELSCLGVPSVLVVTASNQKAIGRFLTSDRLATVVESPGGLGTALANAVAATQAGPSRRWPGLCDGLGARRVVAAMDASHAD